MSWCVVYVMPSNAEVRETAALTTLGAAEDLRQSLESMGAREATVVEVSR